MTATRILVVEDSGIVALSMKHMLEMLGYEVPETAATGESTIEKAERLSPDLIIMDIQLAGDMDGISTSQVVRERFDIPVIFLTGYTDQDTLGRAKLTGPFGYLLKPPEPKELQMAIEMALYKHETERRLREQEEKYRLLFEHSPEPIILLGLDGAIIDCNEATLQLYGRPKEQIIGHNYTEIALLRPDDLARYLELFSRLAAGEHSAPITIELLSRDSQDSRWVEAFASTLYVDGQITAVQVISRDITEQKLASEEIRHYQENLEALVAERTTALETMNNQLQQEITERKLAQDMMMLQTQQLARSNAELEQFAYVASHDLREPLRKVKSFTELLAKRYRDRLDERADKYIDYIVDGTTRMQELITELLMYSQLGRSDTDFNITALDVILDAVLCDLELTIRERQAVITSDTLPVLIVDDNQIGRLLLNLIGNALKFHGDRQPKIHISAQRQEKDWLLGVSDNGIGIEPQYRERIFLIFQRLHTQREYPGTGIGLAVCKKIVENHNGRIWVESETGKGTTFYFTLPVLEETT